MVVELPIKDNLRMEKLAGSSFAELENSTVINNFVLIAEITPYDWLIKNLSQL